MNVIDPMFRMKVIKSINLIVRFLKVNFGDIFFNYSEPHSNAN